MMIFTGLTPIKIIHLFIISFDGYYEIEWHGWWYDGSLSCYMWVGRWEGSRKQEMKHFVTSWSSEMDNG